MKTRILVLVLLLSTVNIFAGELEDIRKAGVLRHLGVRYANFVTGTGAGLDVEVMQQFARHLGVRYEHVEVNWSNVIQSLIGSKFDRSEPNVVLVGEHPIRGDIIANGLTILPWREQLVDYSIPTFPTQVWLITSANSDLTPIVPGNNIDQDIAAVRAQLAGCSVLCKANTCLDPKLHDLAGAGADPIQFKAGLNDMVPAVLIGEANATILDVPDALVALEKWGGRIKIIGPISRRQKMGVGFRKDCPELRDAFDKFFEKLWADGTYLKMVRKYYPAVFHYYPKFFVLGNDEAIDTANSSADSIISQ